VGGYGIVTALSALSGAIKALAQEGAAVIDVQVDPDKPALTPKKLVPKLQIGRAIAPKMVESRVCGKPGQYPHHATRLREPILRGGCYNSVERIPELRARLRVGGGAAGVVVGGDLAQEHREIVASTSPAPIRTSGVDRSCCKCHGSDLRLSFRRNLLVAHWLHSLAMIDWRHPFWLEYAPRSLNEPTRDGSNTV
jgi:hypothetical protein